MTISCILGGIVIFFLLTLVNYINNAWWFFAWIVLSVFELPIANAELERKIATLMGKAGLAIKGVFQMDAGKRSKHTNAYFTGIGKVKRIVLFDTLLASHPDEEILSVLAHETGHWLKKHIIKQLVLLEVMSLIGLFIVAKLLNWQLLYQTFGFQEQIDYVGLFLVPVILTPIAYFVRPAGSALSRKYEREADDIAVSLMGTARPMKNALIKLNADM